MKNPSDQTPESNGNSGRAAASGQGMGASRRRFIKGSAAAGPVILTFTSRPVLGFEQACMTPSRMISGNHSGFAGPATCFGTSLCKFKESAQGTSKPDWFNEKFTTVFKSEYISKSISSNGKVEVVQDKLGEVFLNSEAGFDGNGYSVPQFAAHIIAAYLNAQYVPSVSAVLKPNQVIHMWNDVVGAGQFCPQLSMCWDAKGVIGYLNNSGIVPFSSCGTGTLS